MRRRSPQRPAANEPPSAEILVFPQRNGDGAFSGATRALLSLAVRQGAAALRLVREVLMRPAQPVERDAGAAIALLATGMADLAASVEKGDEACARRIEVTMRMLEFVAVSADAAAPSARPGRASEHPETDTAADLLDDVRIWLLTMSHATGPARAARVLARDGLRVAAQVLLVAAHLAGASAAVRPSYPDRTRGRAACDALRGMQERLSLLVRRIAEPEGGSLATTTFTEWR